MQEKHFYEYAVIRVVPRVEREEFLNIGLIMYSKRDNYLNVRYNVDKNKLSLFSSELDVDTLCEYLSAIDKVCSGSNDGGAIANFDLAARFRWLTAVRSASLQTSVARSGFTDNLETTFETLYQELVE